MKTKHIIAVLGTVLMLAACGGNAKPSFNSINIKDGQIILPDYSKYITLSDDPYSYSISTETYELTEDMINSYIDSEKQTTFSNYTQEVDITDRPAQDMDTAVVSYTATIDGKPFNGSDSAKDGVEVVIGYSNLAEGFEEGLIGMSVGEKKDITVTLGDGQTAVYHTKLIRLFGYTIPEITDEMVQETTGDASVKAWHDKLESEIRENYKNAEESAKLNSIISNARLSAEIKNYPDGMIESELEEARATYEQMADTYSVSFDDYCKNYMGMASSDEFDETMTESIKANIADQMTTFEIARKFDIKISEDEFNAEKDRYREQYGLDADADLSTYIKDYTMLTNMAKDKLKEPLLAIATESISEPVTKEPITEENAIQETEITEESIIDESVTQETVDKTTQSIETTTESE